MDDQMKRLHLLAAFFTEMADSDTACNGFKCKTFETTMQHQSFHCSSLLIFYFVNVRKVNGWEAPWTVYCILQESSYFSKLESTSHGVFIPWFSNTSDSHRTQTCCSTLKASKETPMIPKLRFTTHSWGMWAKHSCPIPTEVNKARSSNKSTKHLWWTCSKTGDESKCGPVQRDRRHLLFYHWTPQEQIWMYWSAWIT